MSETSVSEITAEEFFKKSGGDIRDVARAFVYFLKMMDDFIKSRRMDEDIAINRHALKEAVLDYYVDIVRIKEFHNIKVPSDEKKYAYEAYWLLKRKALQVIQLVDEKKKCEFVNEFFVASYLLSAISRKKNIDDDKKGKNENWKKFQELLYYNLKYRHLSQQSLELMIEAFFCGCDFT
jgi:hypothetical protein